MRPGRDPGERRVHELTDDECCVSGVDRPRLHGRGRSPAAGRDEHQAADGSRLLPGYATARAYRSAGSARIPTRGRGRGRLADRRRRSSAPQSKPDGGRITWRETAAAAPRLRRRERKNITSGTAHVNATFNNTMITITDAQGNTIAWSSSGSQGFKGSRKSTPYAAQVAAEDAGRKAMEHGMRTLDIEVKGPGSGANRRCGHCRRWGLRSRRSVM